MIYSGPFRTLFCSWLAPWSASRCLRAPFGIRVDSTLRQYQTPVALVELPEMWPAQWHRCGYPLGCPPHIAMPNFAVFFADDVSSGLELIVATDAAAAEVIALELHTDARLKSMDGALVRRTGQGCWNYTTSRECPTSASRLNIFGITYHRSGASIQPHLELSALKSSIEQMAQAD